MPEEGIGFCFCNLQRYIIVTAGMLINYNWRFCLAFLAFIFVFGELHELAHLIAAYVICHAPGKQVDFNLWTLCDNCTLNPNAKLATLAGPIFSYSMMWLGLILLRTANKTNWIYGFVLVLGNLPFARIFTTAIGGGDETTFLKTTFTDANIIFLKVVGLVIVFLFAFPPLYTAYFRLRGKRRFLQIAALSILPLFIMMLYEFRLLGQVLRMGFLVKSHFLGVADFIYLHTVVMLMVLFVLRKDLVACYSPVHCENPKPGISIKSTPIKSNHSDGE